MPHRHRNCRPIISSVLWFAALGVFVALIGEASSFGANRSGQTIQAFCIDFNWGPGGPNAQVAGIGVYGFAKPRPNSMPLPIAMYQSKPIEAFNGNDRNIATLARAYNELPLDAIRNKGGTFVFPLPRPSPQQYVWHEQERIQFVCLDPCTWQGREYDNNSTNLKTMTLPKLNTDQWCEAAQAWGAKQLLFVAKHTGGFCWWQTDTSDYSVKNIAWKNGKGDLLEEVAKSCGKYGLNIGIYVYPGDDTWGAGIGSGGCTRDPSKQEAYNKVFRQQLCEAIRIAKKHTKVTEIWFDGSCIIDVGDVMQEEAPDAVILQGPYANLRWVGTERGSMLYSKSWSTVNRLDLKTGVATSFHSSPDGDAWAPCEVNTTLYDHYWFWSKANEGRRKDLDELMRVFYESVGQGSVMLLNSTPNTDGLIPKDDMKMYQALGAEIERRFGKPIVQTAGSGSEYVIDLKHPTTINHVMIVEDYRHGERVREFLVEGWDGKAWKSLTGGAHVGRKHIAFFDAAVVSKLRLKILSSVAEPLIKHFGAYHVEDFKKPALERHTPFRATDAWIANNRKATQGNWRPCGKWTAGDFESGPAKLKIDLTGKITEAGQWQIKFTPDDSGVRLTFCDTVLLQQGQASVPGVLAQSRENPLLFNINRTAVVTEGTEDIRLNVTIMGGASNGVVFVRKR